MDNKMDTDAYVVMTLLFDLNNSLDMGPTINTVNIIVCTLC